MSARYSKLLRKRLILWFIRSIWGAHNAWSGGLDDKKCSSSLFRLSVSSSSFWTFCSMRFSSIRHRTLVPNSSSDIIELEFLRENFRCHNFPKLCLITISGRVPLLITSPADSKRTTVCVVTKFYCFFLTPEADFISIDDSSDFITMTAHLGLSHCTRLGSPHLFYDSHDVVGGAVLRRRRNRKAFRLLESTQFI